MENLSDHEEVEEEYEESGFSTGKEYSAEYSAEESETLMNFMNTLMKHKRRRMLSERPSQFICFLSLSSGDQGNISHALPPIHPPSPIHQNLPNLFLNKLSN